MNKQTAKSVVLFSGALILAALFFWLGYKCLFASVADFSPTVLFILGIGVSFAGIFAMGSDSAGNRLLVGGLPILCGLYLFGRAAGTITEPWLMRFAGVVFWLAGLVLVYVALPRNKSTVS